MPFVTSWVDLQCILLNKISQTEKDKYCMILLTWGIFLKNKINEETKPNQNKHVDTESRVVVSRGEGAGGV